MKLTSIGQVKELMEKYGLHFNKQFGQNFLVNEAVPARIAEECGAAPGDGILEIGPGIGTLTYELAKRYKKVVAVEIDRNLIPVLGETLAEFGNVKIIEGDVMKLDLPSLFAEEFAGMKVTVCANLPYYITTPILMKLLESGVHPENITVMVQKEVADRIVSLPGSDAYGAVTASVAWYGKAVKLFGVPAGCFMPAPKVDSAVMRISLYDTPPAEVRDEGTVRKVIRAAFSQRRKTLTNCLGSEFAGSKAEFAALLESVGISPTVRGETLGIPEFARIANAFSAKEEEKR